MPIRPVSQALFGVLVLIFATQAQAGESAGMALQLTSTLGQIGTAQSVVPEPASALQLQPTLAIDESIIHGLVIAKARTMMDVEYGYGSNSDDAVDCSALIQQAFKTAGIELPRSSREMLASGSAVQRHQLQAGDLMFFRWQRRGLHVAMLLDENTIVHASPGRGRVIVTRLNAAWKKRLVGVRRLI